MPVSAKLLKGVATFPFTVAETEEQEKAMEFPGDARVLCTRRRRRGRLNYYQNPRKGYIGWIKSRHGLLEVFYTGSNWEELPRSASQRQAIAREVPITFEGPPVEPKPEIPLHEQFPGLNNGD